MVAGDQPRRGSHANKRHKCYKSGLVGWFPENQLLNIYQQPTGYLCPSETNGKLHCVGQGWGGEGKQLREVRGWGEREVRESGQRKGRENSRKESKKKETGKGREEERRKTDRERNNTGYPEGNNGSL